MTDSIGFYLKKSKYNAIDNYEIRLDYALKAKKLSEKQGVDSLILKSIINLSKINSRSKNNYKDFLKYSHRALRLAKKMNDSSALALINKELGYYYFDKEVDSAYYYDNKAEKLYRGLKDNFNTAVVLLDIALLQRNDKDYTGSELISVEALSLLSELNESNNVRKYKSFFYNNLALVFKNLEQFEESIKYNIKALDLQKKLDGNNRQTIENQKNNLANSYKGFGEYSIALEYYSQILENKNLVNERPAFYALVLDSYAHTLYLSKNYEQIPKLYFKALRVCNNINEKYKSIAINKHLAEYHYNNKNKDSALHYAYKAKDIAEEYYNYDLLKSLLLLSEIEEGEKAVEHLNAYVKLSDSLQKSERTIRNKFARIKYETNQIEKENIQIAKERMWLIIISIVLIIASFLLYIVINQRNKNKELQFIQKQQETNEEIYNLMLSQNESIEEARTLEKKRISEELHDGVLGRLFGTRLSLDSLNMNSSVEAIKTRGQYINELKVIEQDIRKVSHELNTDFVSGFGFIDIIKTLVETQTLAYHIDYELRPDDAIDWDEVSNKNKIHIYRIIQEVLHNIYKHAKATKVNISFKLKNNVILLAMRDDGSGFDVNRVKSGIGLKNMNSRINDINGKITITSKKDVGTTVTVEAPIT
ncbi:tetratricopeptide repeat-containing sensor histidine kinase [Flavivirga aquatica]|uniref:ATP-binding protein n=1 Tax=Flavivirga aquatica TaxID=1849968 RepID=UPI000F50A8E6|nr:tetratricopeptide repeat-containing sensor histidine kinase [Flavivirga aquatica]